MDELTKSFFRGQIKAFYNTKLMYCIFEVIMNIKINKKKYLIGHIAHSRMRLKV